MVLLIFLLLPAAPITAFGLTGYGLGGLARAGRTRTDRRAWLRSSAALLGAAAAAVYTWGLLGLAGAVLDAEDGGTDSSPLRPCRDPDRPERAIHVVDYSVRYVPLRFVCENKGGGGYAAGSVPGWVNPTALGLAVPAVALATAATYDRKRRAAPDPAA